MRNRNKEGRELQATLTLSPEADSEERLIEAARAGDADVWRELYHRYFHKMYTYAYSRIGDSAAAEDIADFAEPPLQEFKSADRLEEFLAGNGFSVTRPARRAVGSPNIRATRAWANSCSVRLRRNGGISRGSILNHSGENEFIPTVLLDRGVGDKS
ncbi:hypothetical protein LCGC14_2325260 [marine sediment metagenome]|uniref:RNA polymerase sigma-70 region 2 domain-containing protein n=1 Tax=marine sediment metagenome TaxID=412755 RepID=A0A0F9FBH6_9ZZZZ